MASQNPWRTVWITGASSGIGRSLALQLAATGLRVAATARANDRLEEVVASHSNIFAFPADVTKPAEIAAAVDGIEASLGPIDLAIFSAGRYTRIRAAHYDLTQATEENAVNYLGVVNGLAPILPRMLARARGQIAFVSSCAGYCGLPGNAVYGPTKAALIHLAETLRIELEPKGVFVSVVNPGFVDTPMTQKDDIPKPFMIGVDDSAKRIIDGLRDKRFEIAFPWQAAMTMKGLRRLAYRFYFPLVRSIFLKDGEAPMASPNRDA